MRNNRRSREHQSITHFSLRRLIPLIIFLLGVGVSYAQTSTPASAEKWWWAWRGSDHSLIAFNAEGETHVVATPDGVSRFSRISDDTAIAVLQTGDVYALYRLTPQFAVQLTAAITGSFDKTGGIETFRPLQIQWPYAAISMPAGPPAIINFNNNTVESLDRSLPINQCGFDPGGIPYDSCIRFSADGRSLHYIAAVSPSDFNTQVISLERDLATGTEHNFNPPSGLPNIANNHVSCVSDADEAHWLCGWHGEFDNYELNIYWLIDHNGQIRILRILVEQSLYPSRWSVYYSRNSLIVQDTQCKRACSIEVYPYDGSANRTYNLPDSRISPYRTPYVTPLNNGNLLLDTGDLHLYTLTAAGELQALGTEYCCELIDTTSPDYHWTVLATDNGETATVWDLETNQATFHIPAMSAPDIVYTDLGFIIYDVLEDKDKPLVRQVYFNGADNLLEIPIDANGAFVDILPNHTLLYEQRNDGDSLKAGIYRYDPAAKTFTSLVPDADFDFGY